MWCASRAHAATEKVDSEPYESLSVCQKTQASRKQAPNNPSTHEPGCDTHVVKLRCTPSLTQHARRCGSPGAWPTAPRHAPWPAPRLSPTTGSSFGEERHEKDLNRPSTNWTWWEGTCICGVCSSGRAEASSHMSRTCTCAARHPCPRAAPACTCASYMLICSHAHSDCTAGQCQFTSKMAYTQTKTKYSHMCKSSSTHRLQTRSAL